MLQENKLELSSFLQETIKKARQIRFFSVDSGAQCLPDEGDKLQTEIRLNIRQDSMEPENMLDDEFGGLREL